MSRYPTLPAHLEEQLRLVPPSNDGAMAYRPCRVRLRSGDEHECVYVVAAEPYKHWWGVWPETDPGKRSISVEEVVSIGESPHRLPVEIANQLYAAGESGMGYCMFSLEFVDGSTQIYVTGNAVDFVPMPKGKSARDIVAVRPHAGRGQRYVDGLPYFWCLYAE